MERSVKKSFDHCFLAFASTKLLLFLVSFPQYLPKMLARLTVFFHCHRLVPSSKCKSTSRCRSMAHQVTFSGHRGANMRCLHGSAKKHKPQQNYLQVFTMDLLTVHWHWEQFGNFMHAHESWKHNPAMQLLPWVHGKNPRPTCLSFTWSITHAAIHFQVQLNN